MCIVLLRCGVAEEEAANGTAEMIVKITPFGLDAPRLLIRFVFFAEKIQPASQPASEWVRDNKDINIA